MEEIKKIKSLDGHSFCVFIVKPEKEVKGSIIVIQEVFGVNNHIKGVCRRYAEQGYIAIAPALFDRFSPGIELGYDADSFKKGMELYGKVSWDDVIQDVTASFEFAKTIWHEDPAIVGYCFGGTVTWRAAANIPGFKKAICYYGGGIPGFVDEEPKCPVMLHFGAKDHYVTLDQVEVVKQKHPKAIVHIYDADHGFNCEARGSYHAESAELAFRRSLEFLES